ncbi:MAG: ComEC/Rec2 family competence protein, partial [Leucobacter sp.]
MTAAGATGAGPPGTWRLLAPALLGWALTAGAITSPGAGARMAWAAAICGAAVGLGAVIAGAARGRAVSTTVVATAGPGEPQEPPRPPRKRAMTGIVLIVCAVPVLLGARIAVGEHARSDPVLVVAAERGGSIAFEVRLTGFPKTRLSEFGERSWVRAAAETPRGRVPVLLWLDERPGRDWSPGTGLAVRGVPEFFAPEDQAAFGIRVLDIEPLVDEARGLDGRGFGALAADLRRGLHEAAGSVPGAELVPGFAVGDTALVDERLDRAMLESSLTHLTAVSGANCALVTGAMLWLMSRLGAGRRLRLLSAGVALMLFVGLIGPDASVQRAAVMAAVVLASGFGGRRAVALPALGLAVLVLLALDPWQSLQPGFALSVTATGGILLAAGPLANWLRRRARIPAFLALPVAVALAAQLACGPLILMLQAGIPAVGVLANVLAAPAAPLGTGLGLLSALLLPLSPVLGEAALLLASLPARWVAAVAHTSAALPLARWHWPEGWPGALLLAGCEAGLLIAWALHRGHLGLPAG